FRSRRQDQRPHRAAHLSIAERRRSRHRALRHADAAGGVGIGGRDRPSARGHPPRDARSGQGPIRRSRPADHRTRVQTSRPCIRGDLPVRFAPKGGAVPGERIVGILTPGEGITIYPIHSPALTAFDDRPEFWLDVRWDIDSERKELYPTQITVTALNEPGALGI